MLPPVFFTTACIGSSDLNPSAYDFLPPSYHCDNHTQFSFIQQDPMHIGEGTGGVGPRRLEVSIVIPFSGLSFARSDEAEEKPCSLAVVERAELLDEAAA